jgi:L-lactate dehydrogenase complex protein LldG
MSANTITTFEDTLRGLGLGVEITRTTPDEFRDVLEDVVERPAMGAPLPFDGVSYPDWVETDPTSEDLNTAKTGITSAAIGIADYGSLVVQGRPDATEPVSLYPDLHVPVVRGEDILPDMETAFEWLGEEIRTGHSSNIIATGPSVTADMGALVQGAHGPKNVHVVILQEADDE